MIKSIKRYCKNKADDCNRLFYSKGIQGWEQTIYQERKYAYEDVLDYIERLEKEI